MDNDNVTVCDIIRIICR